MTVEETVTKIENNVVHVFTPDLRADLLTLIASWRERSEALQGLINRLDEIAAHPEFKSVWTLGVVHGGDYRGPNWVDALAKARAALEDKP